MAKKTKEKKEDNTLFDQINSAYGEGTIMKLNEDNIISIPRIPSKFISLNDMLGGGLPKGRIIEIYGPEASGKTTLAIHFIVDAQRNGGLVTMIDAEHSYNREYGVRLGVDESKLQLVQPDNGEQALGILDMLISKEEYSVIVVDSVAALTPKSELDGEMGDSKMGLHARLMSQAMRKITAKISKSNAIVIFINQLRDKIGVMFGSPETTTGGNALKFYASIRLDVRASTKIKIGEEIIGNLMRIKTAKNKVATPFQVIEVDLIFGKGISFESDLLKICVGSGVIKRSGSWFSYGEIKLGQGQTKVIELLENDTDLCNELVNVLNSEEDVED